METDELCEQIPRFYEWLARKDSPDFSFPKGGRSARVVRECVERLHRLSGGELSESRVADYCVFQVYFWRKRPETEGVRWMVQNSFGEKAFRRFCDKKRGCTFFEDAWLGFLGLSRKELWRDCFGFSRHVYEGFVLMPSEENTKRRFQNRSEGYVLCGISTLMWSPFSEACQSCLFVPECMKRTAHVFPELYRIRLERERGKI